MKTTIELHLSCSDDSVCGVLYKVLAPDNTKMPRGMTLKMERRGNSLECLMEADSPSGGVSTAMAILRDALLFQEVWLLSRARSPESMGGLPNA